MRLERLLKNWIVRIVFFVLFCFSSEGTWVTFIAML